MFESGRGGKRLFRVAATPRRIPTLLLLPILVMSGLAPSLPVQGRAVPAAQNEPKTLQSPVLEVGKPVERELGGGAAHAYTLVLPAGQYLHVVVEQKGVNVVVRLFGPDGKRLAEVDNRIDPQGVEAVCWVTEAAGNFRLEVVSAEKGAKPGKYEAVVKEIRAATEPDKAQVRDRTAAQTAFAEAGQLRLQPSPANLSQALEKYRQCLPIWRVLGDKPMEAVTLTSMARLFRDLDQKQNAVEPYAQALHIWRALGDRAAEADTHNKIGVVSDALGEKQKALEHLSRALSLQRALGNRKEEAKLLNNIGRVYDTLGEKQKALEYLTQALPLRRAVGDQVGEAGTLNNIGLVYAALGEKQKALEYYAQALALKKAVGNPGMEAKTLNNIGRVYDTLGEKQKALEYYAQALPLERAEGDRTMEARTLTNIGRVYRGLGEPQKALEFYVKALPLERAVGDRFSEAATLFHTAQSLADLGQLEEAKNRIEEALKLVEQIRSGVADQEVKAAYLATVRNYFELYIDLLMRLHRQNPKAGYDKTALQASERARARSLLELLAESQADIRQGLEPELLERERSLKERLNGKLENLTALLNGKHTAEQETAAKKEIDTLTEGFQQVQAEIRRTSPRYAALTQPQPLTVQEIQQQVLAPATVLLEYILGDERSYLFALTQSSLNVYELPPRKEIEPVARQVYHLLTARNRHHREETPTERQARINQADRDFPEAAGTLSRTLLGPVAGQLGRQRLLVVADGALQYVPFAALPEPPGSGIPQPQTGSKNDAKNPEPGTRNLEPLIVEHEVITLPSASALALLRKETVGRPAAEKMLAVLADPVFGGPHDERLRTLTTRATGLAVDEKPGTAPSNLLGDMLLERMLEREDQETGKKTAGAAAGAPAEPVKLGFRIPRLLATRQEAAAILRLTNRQQSLQALDFAASRDTAVNPELGKYKYLHFATHGYLDSERPELSALVLSLVDAAGQPQNGFLRGLEVYNLNLPAELVVLSACETGLGKEIKGEGLVGLTRGFMYAGAKRIVVSLWSVNDAATAALMTSLYRKLLREGQPPAAALRSAQLEMHKSGKWSAPFYWAPFILQGEYH